jgi:hypothetical protein
VNITATAGQARRFYVLMGLIMAGVVLLGFARTYYLKEWFHTPALTLRLHLHAFVLTLWLALFVIQAKLIAVGRRRLHMTLGVAGIVLAALVVVATFAAAIEAARLGGARGGITAADRLFSSVLAVSTFGVFVTLGATFRKQGEIHRRFMLLATIAVIGPGVTRAVVLLAGHPIRDSHVAVMFLLVSSALFNDWRTRSRIHPVLLGGGLFLIASQLTRRIAGATEVWAHIGNWMIY